MLKLPIDQSRLARICDAADAASAAVREANATERDARERLVRKQREVEAIASGRGLRGERPTPPSDADKAQLRRLEADVARLKSASTNASEAAAHARRIASNCLDYARPQGRQLMARPL